jgi:hypothetical protein
MSGNGGYLIKWLSGWQCVEKLPKKYDTNTNSWITSMIFEDCPIQLDRKIGAIDKKILLFLDQCAIHLNTIYLQNMRLCFSQLSVQVSCSFTASSMQSNAIIKGTSFKRQLP